MEGIKNNIIEQVRIARDICNKITDLESEYKSIVFDNVLKLLLADNNSNAGRSNEVSVQTSCVNEPNITGIKSFASLYNRIKPKSHFEKILLAGYFLLKFQNKAVFNKGDIESLYQSAFLKKSSNTNAEINHIIQKGLFMAHNKVDKMNHYCLTADGIDYIEENVLKNAKK
jgi:hypothetical protein